MRYFVSKLIILITFVIPLSAGSEEGEGIAHGTLVKTVEYGLVPVEDLVVRQDYGDTLFSFDTEGITESTLVDKQRKVIDIVGVRVEDEVIYCGPAQKFFAANYNSWVEAQDLRSGDVLLSYIGNEPQL